MRAKLPAPALAEAEPQLGTANRSPPALRPPPNCSLEFDAQADPPAAASAEPLQERSPPPSVGSVSASPSPPGSPKVLCSQFRQAQYDEEMATAEEGNARESLPPPSVGSVSASPSPPGSPKVVCSQFRQAQYDEEMATAEEGNAQQQLPSEITVEETETEWRRRDELARQAPYKNTALFVIAHDGQLHVRKDHRNRQGQAPLCYVDTGYRGAHAPDGQAHQGYMVYNKKDLRWAHRLKFHLRRLQA